MTRAVHSLLPHDGEVAGLLALMLLTDARRAGAHRAGRRADSARPNRTERCGTGQQSRRASRLVTATLSRGSVGVYQLQAAIAAVHDEAPRAEDTDWPQILALYGLLKRMSDNPMVTLNHAIAAAMVNGPSAGLKLLEALDKPIRASPATTVSTPFARTSTRWPATGRQRLLTIRPPPAAPPACPNGTTS